MDKRPIGVFDSGLGGLAVVKELMNVLPNESVVYFGDTGRVPYGSKSRETVLKYAMQDMAFLKSKNVKMIIAACGTVSAVFLKEKKDVKNITFTGVVEPACKAAIAKTKNKNIGVIGTSATVKSEAYKDYIKSIDSEINVFSTDCPMFVHLVENGFFDANNEVAYLVAKEYLSFFEDKNIDTLILGCTHYPLLEGVIKRVLGDGICLIDPGKETAEVAKAMLSEQDMLNSDGDAEYVYYVSDSQENFCQNASRFLMKDIKDSAHTASVDNL